MPQKKSPTIRSPNSGSTGQETFRKESTDATADTPPANSPLATILSGASYLPAIEDLNFLGGEQARGARLQLDYLKPEGLLKNHGIEHTIVVFGSTRIIERAHAQRNVELARAACRTAPTDKEASRRFRVAERLLAKSHYYDIARKFSELVAESGDGVDDSRLVVMTGGGPGTMEAANRGAHDAGGKTVGLNIKLPHEQHPNPYITPELCFRFHYFAIRKLHFMLRAKALVAFPGGYGTLDELFETLTLIQTGTIKPVPVVLVGESYWRKAINIDFLVDEGVIADQDRDLFWYAETAQEIWQGLLDWYHRAGDPLVKETV